MDPARTYTFLLLEDDESDVFLMKRQLERNLDHVVLHVAATQEKYEELIQTADPDIILSDYRLPRYSGIEALLYARRHSPMVPFVFVTGALHNEELAADTILQGASGFVLKNNLDKLWTLLPGLLDGARPDRGTPDARRASARPTASAGEGSPETTAVAGADNGAAIGDELVRQLSSANAETLAKIKRLLSGEEA